MQDGDDVQRNAIHQPPEGARTGMGTDATAYHEISRKKKDEANTQEETEMPTIISPEAEEYCMKHPRRGYALIFNHKTFESERPREGTEKDVAALTHTFEKLGFEVKIFVDLTFRQLFETLESTAEKDHRDCDSLVVTVMSHGTSEGYIHCYDASYRLEKLWRTFTADKCPSLAGKPKLFFIQACRGKKSDVGVRARIIETGLGTQVDSTLTSYTLPVCADILIAQSTVEEYVAWIHPGDGSWFIQVLCEELDKYGCTRELLDILTSVCRRVATDFNSDVPGDENLDRNKQLPVFTSMLTRQVFFH